MDGTSVFAFSQAYVYPINYEEKSLFRDLPEEIAFSSPFELRLFRNPFRATLYVSASCCYKQHRSVNGKETDISSCFCFFVNFAHLAAHAVGISYINDCLPRLLLKC